MGVKVTGLSRLRADQDRRIKRAEDPRAMIRDFTKYFDAKREPNRRNNGGIIRGRWGAGSSRWARNKPSTVKKKGHSRVLHSTPSRSDLLDGLELKSWHRNGSAKHKRDTRVVLRIESDKRYSEYLQDGRSDMEARDIFDLYEGDAKKLIDSAERNAFRTSAVGWLP